MHHSVLIVPSLPILITMHLPHLIHVVLLLLRLFQRLLLPACESNRGLSISTVCHSQHNHLTNHASSPCLPDIFRPPKFLIDVQQCSVNLRYLLRILRLPSLPAVVQDGGGCIEKITALQTCMVSICQHEH